MRWIFQKMPLRQASGGTLCPLGAFLVSLFQEAKIIKLDIVILDSKEVNYVL
jgi:hypothetical protein